MKDESELKSQQIEACNTHISHLNEKIKVLSRSLQEQEAAATQLQSELEKRKQVTSTQLLGFIKLRTQIAELEHRLQEAEEQKLQADLTREATVKEMKAKESLKAQIHAQFGKQSISSVIGILPSSVHYTYCFIHADEPPKIINQPTSLSKVCPGTAVVFTIRATGTEPLKYQWQWKPAEEEGGSEEWQLSDAEWYNSATLTIPSVQKFNEGSYRYVK